MKIAIILAAVLLSGCIKTAGVKDAAVVVDHKYVVMTIPDQMLVIPDEVPNIDLPTATDVEATRWLIDSEKRTKELESRLKAVKTYQENKLKQLQQNLKIKPENLIVN